MYGTSPAEREPAATCPQAANSPVETAHNHGIFPGMNALLSALIFPLASPDATGWPLQPRPQVVHGFELPAKPWLPGHRGVDLAGTPGQPVLAATAGTITYAGPLAGRGVITVATGPRRTTYEPVVAAVKVGTAVSAGAVIGHLSAGGSHCRPAACLHWGLVEGRQYLNPLTLVHDRPVRLLPLSTTSPAPPPGRAAAPVSTASPTRGRTASAIVGAAAALTVAGGLLIRRH